METQEVVIKTITATAYPVYMTGEEIAAVLGMCYSVDNEASEINVTRLTKVLDDLHGETYPGFSVITEGDERIVLNQT